MDDVSANGQYGEVARCFSRLLEPDILHVSTTPNDQTFPYVTVFGRWPLINERIQVTFFFLSILPQPPFNE